MNKQSIEVVSEWRRRKLQTSVRLFSGALACLACVPVLAATADDSSQTAQLEEVIVTATHQTQKLQDVPAAISVIEGAQLEAMGAKDYQDYLNNIPGVTYTGDYLVSHIIIRGVSDGTASGATPLTGLYIDEAPVSEAFVASFDPSLYDVDRVEVLKGPQGTLYGSGSMGGTVRVILNRPKLDVFGGSVELRGGDVSRGGWDTQANAALNVPVMQDHMALRLVGSYRRDGGYLDDVVHNQEDVNTVKKTNGRAELLFKPWEKTSILLGINHQEDSFGQPGPSDDSHPYQVFPTVLYRGSGKNNTNLYSLLLEQDFGSMNLVSATNYLDKKSIYAINAAGLERLVTAILGVPLVPGEGIGVGQLATNVVFSQEVRLRSQGTGPLSWLAGGFYSNVRQDIDQAFDLSQMPALAAMITGPQLATENETDRIRQTAGFGELTYQLAPRLSATLGARVFSYKLTQDALKDGLFNGGQSTTSLESKNSSYTQKYLVNFRATADNLLYAQAAQGFRNGKPNGTVSEVTCGPALRAAGYSSVPAAVAPDKLWNYEIGSKNALMNGRVTVNGAAYYIDWKNIQSLVSLHCGEGFYINAGKATVKGAEIEANVLLWPGLTVGANASFTDAKLNSVAPGVQAAAGDPLPLSTRVSAGFSTQYEAHLFARLKGFARADVNYRSGAWSDFRSQPGALQYGATSVTNLQLGVKGEHWSTALFATNLFDRIVPLARGSSGAPGSPIFLTIAEPRVVGLRVQGEL